MVKTASPMSQKRDPDFIIARDNIKSILDQAMEQLPTMFDLTKQAQSDKMYQAAAGLIKTLVDANVQLSKLVSEKASSPKDAPAPQQITHQNVYVGSTEDYIKIMKERQRAEINSQDCILEAEIVQENKLSASPTSVDSLRSSPSGDEIFQDQNSSGE